MASSLTLSHVRFFWSMPGHPLTLHAALDMLKDAVGLAPTRLPAARGEPIGIIFPFGQQAVPFSWPYALFRSGPRRFAPSASIRERFQASRVDGGTASEPRPGPPRPGFPARIVAETRHPGRRFRSWDSACWRACGILRYLLALPRCDVCFFLANCLPKRGARLFLKSWFFCCRQGKHFPFRTAGTTSPTYRP